MSFHIKYRPKDFSSLKGNYEVISALEKMLDSKDNCPHSFLLTGPTGCGKTTISRIIASKLGCSESDFSELNTADLRGIDTIREIIKNSQFKALDGAIRVWLIDECHKLTNDAQNALLKILEEPPSHIYFILATTDPSKLLDTIKSRCSTFALKPLDESQLMQLMRKIIREENEEVDKEVLEMIYSNSKGYPRTALQILEKVLNTDEADRLQIAKSYEQETNQSIDLCKALIKGASWKEIRLILSNIDAEPEEVRRHILGYCQAILLKEENDKAAAIIETFWDSFFYVGKPGLVYACYSITKN